MNNIAINKIEKPKEKLIADGYTYMFQSTKEFIDKYPLHAEHKFTPLQYHGYKETITNIKHVIEELKYELSVYPEFTDILLDKLNQMKSLLKKYE